MANGRLRTANANPYGRESYRVASLEPKWVAKP
jgi:hypothetical protein